jgi:hypothetical protein
MESSQMQFNESRVGSSVVRWLGILINHPPIHARRLISYHKVVVNVDVADIRTDYLI